MDPRATPILLILLFRERELVEQMPLQLELLPLLLGKMLSLRVVIQMPLLPTQWPWVLVLRFLLQTLWLLAVVQL